MLDSRECTPLRSLPLQRVACVPNNMSLLQILDTFQEGRSHMAIVSRYSEERAASIKHEVKKGLTERLKERVGMSDSSSSESDSDSESESEAEHETTHESSAGSTRKSLKKKWKKRFRRGSSERDVEKGEKKEEDAEKEEEKQEVREQSPTLPQSIWARLLAPGREQAMPDDAVLPKDQANEASSRYNPDHFSCTDRMCSFCRVSIHRSPLSVSSLWKMLWKVCFQGYPLATGRLTQPTELIGEEIYDEFDSEGQGRVKTYVSTRRQRSHAPRVRAVSANNVTPVAPFEDSTTVVSAPGHGTDGETPKSRSQPASPTLSSTPADGSISRTSSLGQSLSALVTHRRTIRTSAAGSSPRVGGTGWRAPRERSQGHRSHSESEMTSVGMAGMPDRMASVQEVEAFRISHAQEKSGPDISQYPEGEEEKKD